MSIQTLHDKGIQITPQMDGGVYATSVPVDCVVAGVGDEFTIGYSNNSLNVTFEMGSEAVIGGAFFKVTADETLTLPANTNIYVCARINLSKADGSKGSFEALTSANIKSENLNGSGSIRDMSLYRVTTNATGVTQVVDVRTIGNSNGIASGQTLPASGTEGQIFILYQTMASNQTSLYSYGGSEYYLIVTANVTEQTIDATAKLIPRYDGASFISHQNNTLQVSIGSLTSESVAGPNCSKSNPIVVSATANNVSGGEYTCKATWTNPTWQSGQYDPKSGSVSIKVTVEENGTIRIYKISAWQMGTPYVYKNGQWNKGSAYIYKNGQWQKGKQNMSIRITGLPEASELQDNDYFVIDDGTTTQKIKGDTLFGNIFDVIFKEVVSPTENPVGISAVKQKLSAITTYSPKQAEGTPSPSNPLPITGTDRDSIQVTGKNIAPNVRTTTTTNGVTFTINADKSVTANGTATANTAFYTTGTSGSDILPIPKGEYILNGCQGGSSTTYRIRLYRYVGNVSSGTYVNDSGDTACDMSDYDGFRIAIYVANGVTLNNVTFYPMLRLATETDSTYEQFKGTSNTIDFNRTLYSGSYNTDGTLTEDMVAIDLGGLSWSYTSNYFRASISGQDQNKRADFICENYSYDGSLSDGTFVTTASQLRIRDDSFSGNVASFTSAVNGVKFCYYLANANTYNIDDLEVSLYNGKNVIQSDNADGIQVTYKKPAWEQ